MTQFLWPEGKRAAVALTFDLDGETTAYVRDRENADRRLTLMSESSYGPLVGMPRILDLLELYEVRATFFTPGFTAELHPDLMRRITKDHTVGHHGYMHERPDTVDAAHEEAILIRGLEALKSSAGVRPAGYRSPAWEIKPNTPGLLVRHGFTYDSSLMGGDVPYIVRCADGEIIELPIHWTADDWPQFGGMHGYASPHKAFEVFSEEFHGLFDRGGLFTMTMHPQVSGRPSRLRALEHLIRFMRGFPRVWWATLEDVATWCAHPEVRQTMDVRDAVIPPPRWID